MNPSPSGDLPIRSLPIVEQYDCHGCGDCCFGTIIRLTPEDYERIRKQRWEEHPDYRGVKIFVRAGLLGGEYQLAKRGDGACIFLTPERRCRIHQDFGAEAKPLICQMAPLQLVPLEQFAYLTVRRYCRSAAKDHGRPLAEHCQEHRELVERNGAGPKPTRPPAIARGRPRPWKDTFRVTDALGRLMLDRRYPLVRRLAHGLEFCGLMGSCRFDRLDSARLAELITMLEQGALQEVGDLFAKPLPPSRQTMRLFRQTALEYLRLHPRFVPERSWRERWRLVAAAVRFARGRGPVPVFRLPFPRSTFEDLERPLGHLDQAVGRPIEAYFETITVSLRFAVLGRPRWSICQSFQALALSYAVAMWVLRLASAQRSPTAEDAVEAAMLLDRAQGYAPLVGRRHRFRVGVLAHRRELARVAVWYAR
jgi:lysine-N-methylase